MPESNNMTELIRDLELSRMKQVRRRIFEAPLTDAEVLRDLLAQADEPLIYDQLVFRHQFDPLEDR